MYLEYVKTQRRGKKHNSSWLQGRLGCKHPKTRLLASQYWDDGPGGLVADALSERREKLSPSEERSLAGRGNAEKRKVSDALSERREKLSPSEERSPAGRSSGSEMLEIVTRNAPRAPKYWKS